MTATQLPTREEEHRSHSHTQQMRCTNMTGPRNTTSRHGLRP
jgi:hypothetical protein